jgi:hypothetical protein
VVAVTSAFLPALRRSAHPRIVNISSGTASLAAPAGQAEGVIAFAGKPTGALGAYRSSKTALNERVSVPTRVATAWSSVAGYSREWGGPFGQQRQRQRQDDRRARALHRAGRDEHAGVGGQGRGGARRGEDRQPDHKHRNTGWSASALVCVLAQGRILPRRRSARRAQFRRASGDARF